MQNYKDETLWDNQAKKAEMKSTELGMDNKNSMERNHIWTILNIRLTTKG